jgi:hypothetical protein
MSSSEPGAIVAGMPVTTPVINLPIMSTGREYTHVKPEKMQNTIVERI